MFRPMGARTAPEPSCIFCRIVADPSGSTVVYEDGEYLAFLDLFPVTRGHVLVVPKRHVNRLVDLSTEAYAGFLAAIAQVCRKVERLSTHYNVSLNQGELAGQIVFHLHFHVIPRYGEGTPQWTHPRAQLTNDEARELRSLLA